jgi:hypothetical protein
VRRTFTRDGTFGNSASGDALSPGHPLERDDFPVYLIQLAAKMNN